MTEAIKDSAVLLNLLALPGDNTSYPYIRDGSGATGLITDFGDDFSGDNDYQMVINFQFVIPVAKGVTSGAEETLYVYFYLKDSSSNITHEAILVFRTYNYLLEGRVYAKGRGSGGLDSNASAFVSLTPATEYIVQILFKRNDHGVYHGNWTSVDIYNDPLKTSTIITANSNAVGDRPEGTFGPAVKYQAFFGMFPSTHYGHNISILLGSALAYVQDATTTPIPTTVCLTEGDHYKRMPYDGASKYKRVNVTMFQQYDYSPAIVQPETTHGTMSNEAPSQSNKSGGSRAAYYQTYFTEVKNTLDKALTIDESDLSASPPWNIITDTINFLWNQLIAPGFEIVTDVVVEVICAVLASGGYLVDGIISASAEVIENFFDSFVTWLRSNFACSVIDTYAVGVNVGEVIAGGIDDYGIDGATEKVMGVKLQKSDWESLGSGSVTLPKNVRLTLFGFNFDAHILAAIFSWIPAGLRNLTIPGSENWPGRRSGDSRVATLVTGYEGVGVPWIDGLAAFFCYSVGAGLIIKLGVNSPRMIYAVLKWLFGTGVRQPTHKEMVTLMGVPYGSNYAPSGNDLWDELDSRLDIIDVNIATVDDVVDSIKTVTDVINTSNIDLIDEIKDVTDLINTDNIDLLPDINSKVDVIDGVVDSILVDTANINDEMIISVPGTLKYLVGDLTTKIGDEETGFLSDFNDAVSTISSFDELFRLWLAYLGDPIHTARPSVLVASL